MKAAGLGVIAAVLVLAPAAGNADSLMPVRLQVSIPRVARLHRALPVTVQVEADAGALDVRNGAVYARVKLAPGVCGSTFESTTGTTLLNRALRPQPDPGEAYQGRARGSASTTRRGVQVACVFIEDQGDDRLFAYDTTDYKVRVR